MLINIVNRESNTHFRQLFKETIILPENSKITLKKAIIKLEPKILINSSNDNFRICVNGISTGTFTSIVLTHGKYTKKDFLLHVVEKINNVLGNGQENFTATLEYFDDNSIAPNCYTISIKCHTTSPSTIELTQFETGFFETEQNWFTSNTTAGTLYFNYDSTLNPPVNYIGLHGQGQNSFANTTFISQPIERTWFNSSSSITQAIPINNTSKYGLMQWTSQKNSLDYIIGFSDSNLDLSYVSSNLIAEYLKIKNLTAGIFYNGSENKIMILESSNQKQGNANLSLIKEFNATGYYSNLMDENTEFAIMLIDDPQASPKYFYKGASHEVWTELSCLNDISPPKRCVMDQHSHYPVVALYSNANGTNNSDFPISNFSYSGISNITNTQNYGKFISLDMNEIKEELGLSSIYNTIQTYGNEVAELKLFNSLPLNTTSSNEPYLNVNITNLPIKSYANNDSNDLDAGLSQVKTLACVPRYNTDGILNSSNLIYDDNTQILSLNNSGEITLNELNVDLRNADGSIPDDVGNLKSFVLMINK